MAKKAAKGWTHPRHWKVATVGTVCQILALVFIILAVFVTPFFTDRRNDQFYKITDMDIKCQVDYCYNSADQDLADPDPVNGQVRRTPLQIANKPAAGWLNTARVLILVGFILNLISLALLVLVFWPIVLAGKVINIILLICRLLDFIGAPTKFIGGMFFICHLPLINENFSWWKYEGILQVDPLPLGLVMFSYILQTLCFVCSTLAMDIGAKGKESHIAFIKHQHLFESLELEEPQGFQRVSYHPIDTKRSSRILSSVSEHNAARSIGGESNV